MESILEAIGNTPLVRVRRCAPSNGAELWLKLEYRNPTRIDEGPDGSRDDRGSGTRRLDLRRRHRRRVHGRQHGPRARARLQGQGIPRADRDGRLLHRGALSADARARGGDRRRSVGRGPAEGDSRRTSRTWSREPPSSRRAPGHYATDQFNNPYIIPDHRDRLGREIWEQTAGRVTAFCQGMGTASSVLGVSDALKPHGVFIQAHEPAGVGGDQRRRARHRSSFRAGPGS